MQIKMEQKYKMAVWNNTAKQKRSWKRKLQKRSSIDIEQKKK